jgi:hypothetical protein
MSLNKNLFDSIKANLNDKENINDDNIENEVGMDQGDFDQAVDFNQDPPNNTSPKVAHKAVVTPILDVQGASSRSTRSQKSAEQETSKKRNQSPKEPETSALQANKRARVTSKTTPSVEPKLPVAKSPLPQTSNSSELPASRSPLPQISNSPELLASKSPLPQTSTTTRDRAQINKKIKEKKIKLINKAIL